METETPIRHTVSMDRFAHCHLSEQDTMPVDYHDAAERHLEDAKYLMSDSRWANADHLFGLSAECALKAVLLGLGEMRLNPKGEPEKKKHKVHIDKLWGEFTAFDAGRTSGGYSAGLESSRNPFADWNVSQRYNHRNDISESALRAHESGARDAKRFLDEALLNGDLHNEGK